MITVQREAIADILPELKPLLAEHWREVAHYQDIELAPNYEFYSTCTALRCFTVREEDVLIGYAIFGVAHNKHYMDSLQAVQDILFVHPEHRGSAGARLVKFADAQLRKEGVQAVYHHVKMQHPTLGLLLDRMGYETVEVVMAKRLDKE